MIKAIILFLAGIIETFLYTGHLLAVDKRKAGAASILMYLYMAIYLTLIKWAFDDVHSFILVNVYALSNSLGVFLRLKYERIRIKKQYNHQNVIGIK